MSTDVELRWGYTLTDLEHVAQKAAAVTRRAYSRDYHDRYADAYSAAAEALYAATTPPTEFDLFRAAQDALWAEAKAQISYRGRPWDGTGYGDTGTARNFVRYWTDICAAAPSPETLVVEWMALAQIVPALSRRQQEVLGALVAANGDVTTTAKMLGIAAPAVTNRVTRARRAALALWLEGETPQQVRCSRKRRRQPAHAVAPCGTPAAAYRHRNHRETLCDPCAEALRQHRATYEAQRKSQQAPA